MSDLRGGGSCGWAPIPAASGNRAVLPQLATSTAKPEANSREEVCMEWQTAIKMPPADRPALAMQHLFTVTEVQIFGNFAPDCTVNGRGLGGQQVA